MRGLILGLALATISTAAAAQTTTNTSCYQVGGSVQCNSTTSAPPPTSTVDWGSFYRQQQQTQQNTALLGAAIAADRERRQQAKIEKAVKLALANDNAPPPPVPPDEKPVLLACNLDKGPPLTVALYEKHNRVDITGEGQTKTRVATFTNEAVTWTSPVMHFSLSRLDGSYTGYGKIPELEGYTISGACTVATERKF